jgi:hypothetical protein
MGQATHGQGYAVGALEAMGDGEAIVLVAGGKDGYVGRDGQPVGDGPHDGPPGAAPS